MQYVKPDVSTMCVGLAASAAAVLLSSGAKGKRYALPNAEIMIHQVFGGAEGQAIEIKIEAEHIIRVKSRINEILARHTAQSIAKIERDTDRNFYMNTDEAVKYGIIDEVIRSKTTRTNNRKETAVKSPALTAAE